MVKKFKLLNNKHIERPDNITNIFDKPDGTIVYEATEPTTRWEADCGCIIIFSKDLDVKFVQNQCPTHINVQKKNMMKELKKWDMANQIANPDQ